MSKPLIITLVILVILIAIMIALYFLGKKAQKNCKIYNGMIKTYFYQFLGPKPPKKGKRP